MPECSTRLNTSKPLKAIPHQPPPSAISASSSHVKRKRQTCATLVIICCFTQPTKSLDGWVGRWVSRWVGTWIGGWVGITKCAARTSKQGKSAIRRRRKTRKSKIRPKTRKRCLDGRKRELFSIVRNVNIDQTITCTSNSSQHVFHFE